MKVYLPSTPLKMLMIAAAVLLALVAASGIERPVYAANAPVITSVSGACQLSGGQTLNITGTGLSGVNGAAISSQQTGFTGLSDTAMTVVCAPEPFPGVYPLTVTTPTGGTSAPFPSVPYLGPNGPTITSVNPSAGPAGGGTNVTITGTNLTGGSVYFGQLLASCQPPVSPFTSLACTSPASSQAGTIDIQVRANTGPTAYTAADHFTYTTGPSISGISPGSAPASGAPVTPVTITGTNLATATSVSFGTTIITQANFTATATTINVYAPAHAPDVVDVTVTTPDGSFTLPRAFRFVGTAAPTIVNVVPGTGPVGTTVTITGTGFAALTGVTFGNAPSTQISVLSDTSLTAVVPAGLAAGNVDVTVQTSNGSATDASGFDVTSSAAPVVGSLSPVSGGPGTSVTILGSGFTSATSVTFGGVAATYTINSDTSITATAPAGMATGPVEVVVTSGAGSSTTSDASTFTNTSGPIVPLILQGRFTLIGWIGADGISPRDALRGGPSGPANGTNDITSYVASIWSYNSATGTWLGYFPGVNIPGANDLTALKFGAGYFVALLNPANGKVPWLVARGSVAGAG